MSQLIEHLYPQIHAAAALMVSAPASSLSDFTGPDDGDVVEKAHSIVDMAVLLNLLHADDREAAVDACYHALNDALDALEVAA